MVTHTPHVGRGVQESIGIAQRVFGRPSASLRMLPNIGPTFLQKDWILRGAGLLARGFLGRGGGGVAW